MNPTYVYEIGSAIYNSSSQSSYLFIGVVGETMSFCDIKSQFIDAAVDAASICQVLLSLINSKIICEFYLI